MEKAGDGLQDESTDDDDANYRVAVASFELESKNVSLEDLQTKRRVKILPVRTCDLG